MKVPVTSTSDDDVAKARTLNFDRSVIKSKIAPTTTMLIATVINSRKSSSDNGFLRRGSWLVTMPCIIVHMDSLTFESFVLAFLSQAG